jgi:hypothetical protein
MMGGLRKKREFGLADRDSRNFVGLETTGTDLHGFNGTLEQHPQFFQIGVPPPPGGIFGVTHVIPEHGAFVTHFTSFGHQKLLLT